MNIEEIIRLHRVGLEERVKGLFRRYTVPAGYPGTGSYPGKTTLLRPVMVLVLLFFFSFLGSYALLQSRVPAGRIGDSSLKKDIALAFRVFPSSPDVFLGGGD